MSVIINHNHIGTANLVVSYDMLNSNSYSQAENGYTYSQAFTNWGAAETTVTDNSGIVTAPDGTSTASLLIPSVNSAIHRISQTVTCTAGITYTVSVYAKAYGYNFLYVNVGQSLSVNSPTFNLQNGTISNPGNAVVGITSAGNGWWRCTVTATCISTQTFQHFYQVNTVGNVGDQVYTGNGTSGILLWGAQLERGSSVMPYTVTTASVITRSATIPNIVTPGTYNGTANVTYWDAGGGTGARAPAFFFNNQTSNVISANTIPASFWQGSWTAIVAVKMNQVNKGYDNAMISHGGLVGNGGLHLGERYSRLYMGFYGNDVGGATNLVANRWYVFTWSYNASTLYRTTYIDGLIESFQSTAAYIGTGTNTEIGRYTWATEYGMFGHIGAVKLFSKALGASEIYQESKAMQKQ